jgi:hypothetical protein
MSPQHHARRRRCKPVQRQPHVWMRWTGLLTMDSLRAGRIECEHRDGRDDDGQGHAVPGQLEGSEGQDVRSPPCTRARDGAALAPSSLAYMNAMTDSMQRPSDSSPLPHPPGQGTLLALPASTSPTDCAQNEMPEYYEATKLPMALDTIEVCPISHMSENMSAAYTRSQALPNSTTVDRRSSSSSVTRMSYHNEPTLANL